MKAILDKYTKELFEELGWKLRNGIYFNPNEIISRNADGYRFYLTISTDVALQIAKEVKRRELELEHYYLEKLSKVYDEINTGIAKKQTNQSFYTDKAISVETELSYVEQQLKELEKK